MKLDHAHFDLTAHDLTLRDDIGYVTSVLNFKLLSLFRFYIKVAFKIF